MRGRKPKAATVHLLNRNPGNRPVNVHEPEPAPLDVTCPTELHDDPLAVEEWTRGIVPAITIGQLTSADRVLAIAHCALWSTWQSQLAAANLHPHVVPAGPNGYPIPNAARGMANKTLTMLARIDIELGFSPISRTRVRATPPGKAQPTPTERLKAEYR
jgi:phage terminase small subunit